MPLFLIALVLAAVGVNIMDGKIRKVVKESNDFKKTVLVVKAPPCPEDFPIRTKDGTCAKEAPHANDSH